jgi:hypothetical protein
MADGLLSDRNPEPIARVLARRRLSVRRGHGRDARVRGGSDTASRTRNKMAGLPVARAYRLAGLSIQRNRVGKDDARHLARHQLQHGLPQRDRYTPSPRAEGPVREICEAEKAPVFGAVLIAKSKLNRCSNTPGV